MRVHGFGLYYYTLHSHFLAKGARLGREFIQSEAVLSVDKARRACLLL